MFDNSAMGQTNDLYSQAVAIVMRDRKASTSYIQRRLQIGYNRAASLMEKMELEGIVGAANHAGKREILVGEPEHAHVLRCHATRRHVTQEGPRNRHSRAISMAARWRTGCGNASPAIVDRRLPVRAARRSGVRPAGPGADPAPKPKIRHRPAARRRPRRPGPQAQLAPPRSRATRLPVQACPGFSQPGTTTAFDANQRALIDRVNVYLMSVQTLVGDFVQVGPDGRRAEGKIYLQKPGRVRFEYNPPSPIELVSDGSSLVVRDRKLETQDLYPLSQTPLRFLLADRIDLLRETNVIAVSADDTVRQPDDRGKADARRHPQGAADVLRQGHAAQAVDHHRPAGLRHHGRAAIISITRKKLDPAMFRINYERKEIIQ